MGYSDPEKQRQAQHESYLRNRDKVRQASKKTRDGRRDWLRSIKEASACMDCNVFYPYYVMQFDHRDGADKVNTINKMLHRVSREKTIEEIEKCDLVCANCHAVRTFNRAQ